MLASIKPLRLWPVLAVCACATLLATVVMHESRPEVGAVAANVSRPAAMAAADLSTGDWNGIRAAHATARHSVRRVAAGGYEARNPEQRWHTSFDGRGSTTWPDAGGWSWGLQVERYGFRGHELDIEGTACAHADGDRMSYGWGPGLEE